MKSQILVSLFTVALVSMLAGCGAEPSDAKDSQVIATVNDKEITESQLRQATFAASGDSTDDSTPAETKKVLDSLINEELLVQKAIGMKLDRDPAVIRAIESARRQILVRVYAERAVFPTGEIPQADKRQYYDDNPLLFQKRKIYQLVMFDVAKYDSGINLHAELEQTHNADQVRDVLTRHQLAFTSQVISRTTEDLPTETLPQFAKAQIGDTLMTGENTGRTVLLTVRAVADSPIDFEEASPRIQKYLIATRDRKALEDRVRETKMVAKITYSPKISELQTQAVSESQSALSNAGRL